MFTLFGRSLSTQDSVHFYSHPRGITSHMGRKKTKKDVAHNFSTIEKLFLIVKGWEQSRSCKIIEITSYNISLE